MERRDPQFRLVGGRLCLNFTNTADWSADGAVIGEKLNNISDILAWRKAAELHGILVPDRRTCRDKVLRLRINRRQILVSLINGDQPDDKLLAEFNREFRTDGAISLTTGIEGALRYGPET